ncbi:MAG: D-hexose-6-phosphate mutarotase [Chthoniobacter sp.]|nr:D-hexose-6-phosphate mutarotase [Chthoniobacter sp.]
MKSPSSLRRLEIPGIATFEPGEGDLARLTVRSALAEAHIYLHGAHVTHFQPKDKAPVLFMSQRSLFAADKPIRGGVPLIFPWFGPRAHHPESPAHGFARTSEWQIESLSEDGDGVVVAAFHLASDDRTRALWPFDFELHYRVAIGRTLTLTFEVKNTSTQPFDFEDALHTYFTVSDVRETSTTGLENAEYVDKTDAQQRKNQGPDPIRITAETDRVFENTRKTCIVDDPGLKRKITIDKSGSQTTVVWNPWIAKSAAMADFGDDEWPKMLCIETANAAANLLTLDPGKTHSTRAVISVS